MTKEKKKTKAKEYRPCVGVCLLNENNQVFVAERIDTPGAWQMPQGGIDKGEDPMDAAFRELEEEIGTGAACFLSRTDDWLHYDFPKELGAKAFKGKYVGQKQIWFALRYEGQDADINLETAHPEFSRWKWVGLEETVDLIVPFKREIYVEVVNHFRSLTQVQPD